MIDKWRPNPTKRLSDYLVSQEVVDMIDEWRPNPTQLSVPLRHADGRPFTEEEMRTLTDWRKLVLGAGTLPPEIRNIGKELPASGETTPAARTPNSDHATDGDSDGIVCE